MSTTKYKGRTIEIIATKRGFYARVSVIETRPKIPPFSLPLLARYGKRNKSLIGNHAMSETRSHLYNQQEVNAGAIST